MLFCTSVCASEIPTEEVRFRGRWVCWDEIAVRKLAFAARGMGYIAEYFLCFNKGVRCVIAEIR